MRHYQNVPFIVISYCIMFCAPLGVVAMNSNCETLSGAVPAVNQKVLYKVDIDVFKNHFSGLLLIKKGQKDTDLHIVLLSEVGLTLCEYYSDGQSMKLVQASSIFQAKSAQKVLAADFSMLTHPKSIKKQKQDRLKTKSGIVMHTNADGTIGKMRKRRIFNGIRVDLSNYYKGVPSDIAIKHGGINLKLKLNLLKVD